MPRARLLWTLVVVGALCALAALVSRVHLERNIRGVDLLIDYYALQDFCQSEGLDPRDTLDKLKAAGATAVAFPETSLERLVGNGQISVYSGADFARLLRGGQAGLPRATVKPAADKTYFAVYDPGVLADLETFLPVALGPNRFNTWPKADDTAVPTDKQPVILELSTSERALQGVGLGFSREEVEAAHSRGLNVYLRPQNRPRFQDADVAAFFESLKTLKPVRGVIFEGLSNEVVGYPDSLDATEKAMRGQGLLFGNIEAPTVEAAQKGSQTLGRRLDDLTVRVFSLAPLQQAKMTPDDALDRYRLGTRERNMRVLYLRFFAAPEVGKSVLETNLAYVKAMRDDLTHAGFSFDGAKPFPDIHPQPWWLIGMTLGAAAAGILFLEIFMVVPGWLTWAVLGGLPLLAAASALLHRGVYVSTGMALEAALVFSVLGLAFGLPMMQVESSEAQSPRAAVLGAILPLVLVTLVSLVGGLYMAGFMADTTFMLSVHQFRGIKLIMVVAPAIVVFLYVTRYAPHRETLVDLLQRRVVFWHIAAVAVLAAVGAFYIARTGNASPAAASDTERYVRDFLETTLVVRPRFKEFALGHPAWFLMAVLLWKRRGDAWLWLLTLCVAIGQVDVVDTFAHAHTPYLISLVRAFIGLGLGIVVGVAGSLIVARFLPEGIPNESGGSIDDADRLGGPRPADAPWAGTEPPSTPSRR